MADLQIKFLTEGEMPALHDTFLKAFDDYLVPIQLTREQFETKRKREGIDPGFCVAAFSGAEMAGFILTGLGEWQGKPTAYNAGTGVVPQYRGRSLTRRLYGHLLPRLRESGLEQCLLEVMQENTAALKAYKGTGFRVTRALNCYRARKQELLLPAEAPESITITEARKRNWQIYTSFWDVEPSWQNTSAAIKRSPDSKMVLEAHNGEQQLVGYIAFFPHNGSVAQLAVHSKYRGNGIGTALLRKAVRLMEAPGVLFINVDTAAESFLAFLKRRHVPLILRQYEMLLPIG